MSHTTRVGRLMFALMFALVFSSGSASAQGRDGVPALPAPDQPVVLRTTHTRLLRATSCPSKAAFPLWRTRWRLDATAASRELSHACLRRMHFHRDKCILGGAGQSRLASGMGLLQQKTT